MAVAHDAATEGTGTADPTDVAHTPVGTPRGVLVLIGHGTTSTDIVVGVTYGGTAMTRIATAADTADEPGRAYAYRLLASVPTGAQTASVDRNEATTNMHVEVITVTASADTAIEDFEILEENVADPSVTLAYGGKTCLTYAVIYSGFAAIGQQAPNANMTAVHDTDFGNFVVRVDRQTTPGTADFTASWTSAGGTADDNALVAVAITEAAAAGGIAIPVIERQFRARWG